MRAGRARGLADLEFGQKFLFREHGPVMKWVREDAMSTTTGSSSTAGLIGLGLQPPSRLRAYAVIAAGSFVSYILSRLLGGGVGTAFEAVGVGACGWAWLLTRALFDPAPRDVLWPRIVGPLVAASGAMAVLTAEGGLASRVAGNVYALGGSTALLLTFVEPFNRYRRDMPGGEKRFRLAFLGLYAVLVAASVLGLWVSNGSEADALRDDWTKGGSAVVGLCAVMAAVWFRLRNPLTDPVPVRRAPTAEDARLAERLLRLLRDEEIDSDPDLRIGDVAARLGEPEYRVSQCIGAAMGFPNFNRLINHHRIERAKARLTDAADDASILQIAFDCGFGSIGPFNRAFRDQVGTTPRAYRSARRQPVGISKEPMVGDVGFEPTTR
ncbi:helix-turn-helix domain-containing protein [Brevundimonas sp.]|uniref:helix-turn-helix domain-containing protein n=1 Tax=Brevundimonas sp. TaxID=1871086 RepID=UPI0038D4F3B9